MPSHYNTPRSTTPRSTTPRSTTPRSTTPRSTNQSTTTTTRGSTRRTANTTPQEVGGYKIYGTNQVYNGKVVGVGGRWYTTVGGSLEGDSKEVIEVKAGAGNKNTSDELPVMGNKTSPSMPTIGGKATVTLGAQNPGHGIDWETWELHCPSRNQTLTHNDSGTYMDQMAAISRDCPTWTGSASSH